MMYCGAHTGISADDANNLSGYFDLSRRFNLRHTFRLSSGAAFFATPDEVRFRVRSFSIYFSVIHRRLAFLTSLERIFSGILSREQMLTLFAGFLQIGRFGTKRIKYWLGLAADPSLFSKKADQRFVVQTKNATKKMPRRTLGSS